MVDDGAKGFPRRVKTLIVLLGEPEKGELNYNRKKRKMARLDALRELKHLEDKGVINRPSKQCGVNLHLHTNESFSVFRSPTEAAWKGYRAGLKILGINDHYTIDGHKEFGEACRILGIKATFNIEVMAMLEEAKKSGERTNDPKNPGRTYLCGKGVMHDLEPGSSSEHLLTTMRSAFRRRCQVMTMKVNALLEEADPSLNLLFDDVLQLTPRGNVTERHIAQAVAELIERKFKKLNERKTFLIRLIGCFNAKELKSDDKFQDLIRNRLLKTGGPAYVEEPSEAFPSIQSIVQLFRDYGAIPTYPVLGNPITEKESDLDSLFDELEKYRIFAVEVIPKRNTRERLSEILNIAEKHEFPVFTGTEQNTKAPEPLVDKFSYDPQFLQVFERGAYFLLGHQFLSNYARKGYIDQNGDLTIKDRKTGRSLFGFVGALTWADEASSWLQKIGIKNVYKMVLGLHLALGREEICMLNVKPNFKIPIGFLKKIHLKKGYAFFQDNYVKREFYSIIRKFIVST